MPATGTDGARITLGDGSVLIDGVGSWWTNVHGYNHPRIVDAVTAQLSAMPHVMLGGLVHEQAALLAERLAKLTPGDLSRAFFCESGSVSVEVAMKIAVQFWRNKFGEQRSKFVYFRGGYHGDTFATMSLCDPDEGMHVFFAGALAEQYLTELPEDDQSIDALKKLLAAHKDIAGVIVEPLIQGAGGMRMHDEDCLRALRQLCDEANTLLICDEIFTGFGRTGAMFACEKAAITPDIMTLGKALTGGVAPLAAAIASDHVYEAFHDDDLSKALMHGPTYTGHALACAAANASIDLFETEPRLSQVAAIEAQLSAELSSLRDDGRVRDVRVMGAVGAVETRDDFDIDQARAWFIERGFFIRPIGRVIYLTPTYVIAPEDLSGLTGAIVDFVKTL